MSDGRACVYLLGEDDKVTSRPVVTGRRRGDRVEIVSGLQAGAHIVASGGAFLSEGARVTVVAAASAPADSSEGNGR